MSPSRREFLSQTALAAAMAGLGPGIASLLAQQKPGARPYLHLAVRCAEWIDKSAIDQGAGRIAWPADPLKPASVGFDFYNGMPGIIYFYANLYHATNDPQWRSKGLRAGGYAMRQTGVGRQREPGGVELDAGLYTGLAGLATTLAVIDDTEQGEGVSGGARGATQQLIARAKTVDNGVEWSASNDIISGTAGIGLFLLYASARWNNRDMGDLAVRAGRRLLKTAQPAEGGLMWFPSATVTRNYPNFSHGTSGVAYFLATLYQQTKELAFLDGALAGAKYLDAVATKRNGARAIFHVSGGGEDRFYLSWCHGPVGTARLFYRLLQITGDPQWRTWIDELTAWLYQSGAPEKQSAGYWNNISQCCGNAGVGQYFIDLARANPALAPAAHSVDMRERVVKNTMSRATNHASGLRWVQAENRVSPENLIAQTGFMQGAAGVGTFFLQLDALERGVRWPTPWPDTPFGN